MKLCVERPELWPNNWIRDHNNASAHEVLSVKQFLAQELIAEMEHQPFSPDLALKEFWLFSKVKKSEKKKNI
jgi:hypothetical protein